MDLCWQSNVYASNRLCRLVIAFLSRSKYLLTSWLQEPSAVILEPKKIKSISVSIVSPFAMKWWDWIPWSLFFECWAFSQFFFTLLSLSSRGSSVPLHFLPQGWCHLHIWGYWYFSLQPWFQLVLHPARHFAWCTLHENESEVTQACPTLCDPMDGSLPGFIVHEIFQARILEWAAISFSRGIFPT